jgi:secernin
MDLERAWALLADHGARADRRAGWGPADHPGGGLLGQTVCAHAGYGPVRVSQTTGSWISELPGCGRPDAHWVTGTAAPCLSVRKPLWFDALAEAGVPDTGPAPGRGHTPGSLWWEHEHLHRTVLLDYPRLRGLIERDRRTVQERIDALAGEAGSGSVADRVACSREAFALAAEAGARWLSEVRVAAPPRRPRGAFHRAWRGFDRSAGRA